MSMNPRETTEKIKSDYKDYIASILHVRDKQITKLAEKAVADNSFVKGPYLEITLPFVEGARLQDLAEEGLISREFSKMGPSVHYSDWKLRIHQENALRHIITDQRNMVVSTGTGSGKTECYLYPVFNAIMREKEAGTLDAGVRALLIFPMNALANDQQKKLRKLLKDYPSITFGRYTGETAHKGEKETPEQAEKRLHEEYDLAHCNDSDESQRKSIPNELMCREMMAENPPHILLTNYAMLEYMLLRPDTAPFFDNSSAKNWRFIVIDEAHTYKGANGTEIAFLLRRLKERIRHHMDDEFRCIATSATLGSNDAKEGLAAFAQSLFDEPFDGSDVITTERANRRKPENGRYFEPDDYAQIKALSKNMEDQQKGSYLYDELKNDLRIFDVYAALKDAPRCIEDVARDVFADIPDDAIREDALINLVELAAAAKKSENDAALLPARYHLFVKSLEGMFAQLYPKKAVFLDRKENIRTETGLYPVFELANCQKCEQEYLVGKTMQRPDGDYFVQTSSTEKPEYYFVADDTANGLEDFDEDDMTEESGNLSSLPQFHLCLRCGRITPFAEKHPMDCCDSTNADKIVTVYNLRYSGKGKESNCCPCCGATKKGLIKRFLTANQPATFAVAKSLYDAIPPRPHIAAKVDDPFDDLFDDIFDDSEDIEMPVQHSELADESGRKLLIFSDNRQEAAFFAGFFEKKYNLIMWRKVILQCLKKAKGGKLCVSDLIGRVMHEADKSGLYSFDMKKKTEMTDDQKHELAACYVMQEFLSPDIGTGLEGLGLISIEPTPIKFKDPNGNLFGLQGEDRWNLLRFMMDTLRQKGAVNYPDPLRATNDFFAPRNHEGYFRLEGSKNDRAGYVFGFVPSDNAKNKRLSMMYKLYGEDEHDPEGMNSEVKENLKGVYSRLMQLAKLGYIDDVSKQASGTVYCLNYARWNFRYIAPNDKLYRCKKCGKLFSYAIKDLCPEMKCNGKLEEVVAGEAQKVPYYSKLFSDEKLIPMLSREHTAQLSSKTAGEYQKDFEEGKINVLSCSTTFEMGVDVGELEATFLRNVPPETSNYIQRAGRAGRRTSSAAFSVTFSRRSSHDMTFYQNPTQIISGKIDPPVLEVGNEKIAERHLNSIVTAWFFKKHPEYFVGKAGKIVSFGQTENMATELRACLNQHPQELLDSIHAALPESVCSSLRVDEWEFIDRLTGQDGQLTKAIIERSADIEGLHIFAETEKAGAGAISKLSKAIAAEKLIATLKDQASISFLSAKGVLPKYGFPIDTVSLDILSGTSEEAKKIDLSRDLKMAISEFAPPASIVANNKVWQSYSINTVPDKGWPTYIYHECPACKKIDPPSDTMVDVMADVTIVPKKNCSRCGTLMNAKKFIIPLFGFSTKMGEKPRPVGETKPSTYYATQTQFWGINDLTEAEKAEAMHDTPIINGKHIELTYSPGGKLFVLNRGTNGSGIRVCPRCGFATGHDTILKGNKHETKYGKSCSNPLVSVALGHEFSTDILKIKLPNHMVNIETTDGNPTKDQYISILYAILEGASTALDINRADINGCIGEDNELILFDDTAGGSGFVKQIYLQFERVMKAALHKVSGICGCAEETSCYGCLRNYSNQYYHDEISRGLARKYLDWLLNDNTVPAQPTQVPPQRQEETVGLKPSHFDPPDTSKEPDTEEKLKEMLAATNDEHIKAGLTKLLKYAGEQNWEHPTDCECINVDQTVWPELLWGKSHVAVFTRDSLDQYRTLKKYDWYCYILDENIDAELLFTHIKKGE